METDKMDYASCVARGIEALEQYQEGVTDRIDLLALDVGTDDLCPASQAVSVALYGEPGHTLYGAALSLLEIEAHEAVGLGFDVHQALRDSLLTGALSQEYDKITAEWVKALTARREPVS